MIGQKVMSPYGQGVIKDIRVIRHHDKMIVVEPSEWLLATKKPPIFYLNPKDIKPYYEVGDKVNCSFGRGLINDIRSDGIHIVKLDKWALATGASPTLYLNQSSIKPVIQNSITTSTKEVSVIEEANAHIEECLLKSNQFKAEASSLFEKKDYAGARKKYFDALSALKYNNDTLSNDHKARAFEQTVPCHNNIALCCLNLGEFNDAIAFARNGLALVEALEARINPNESNGNHGYSMVWYSLITTRGMTSEKLMDWKKKSYFYLAKSFYAKKEYKLSAPYFEAALSLIMQYNVKSANNAFNNISNDMNNHAEIDPILIAKLQKAVLAANNDMKKTMELLNLAKKAHQNQIKKEKSTWTKAFQENSILVAAEEEKEKQRQEQLMKEQEKLQQDAKLEQKPLQLKQQRNGNSSITDTVTAEEKKKESILKKAGKSLINSALASAAHIDINKKQSLSETENDENNNNDNALANYSDCFRGWIVTAGLFSLLGVLSYAGGIRLTHFQFLFSNKRVR